MSAALTDRAAELVWEAALVLAVYSRMVPAR